MEEANHRYHRLNEWRKCHIAQHISSHVELNHFHDHVMKKVLDIAIEEMKRRKGEPPSSFSWFVMGSGGRWEQAKISDQDHGLVYETNDAQSKAYFTALGKEITKGLFLTGYPYCDGNVMCSNPVWCKSIDEMRVQIIDWIKDETWESIRYLLIFFDARVLIGNDYFVKELKHNIYQYVNKNPQLLHRLLDNTMHLKKGIGVFGQLLTKTHGPYTGSIHIKDVGIFPYVNAVRLLSIKENIDVTSTLSRFQRLSQFSAYRYDIERHLLNFKTLLDFRFTFCENPKTYEDVHYLNVNNMNRENKKELKQILQDVSHFHKYTQSVI